MKWCFRPRFFTVLGWGTTWANEMKFLMNHAPCAGLITQPIDLQSSTLATTMLRLPPYVNSFSYNKKYVRGSILNTWVELPQ